MNDLEKMKLNVELMRVKAARAELCYKVAEREDEIKRLREHINIQDEKITELEGKING